MSRKTGKPAKDSSPSSASRWPHFEWGTALALTLWIAFLHVSYFLHAGPLWRDEIGTIDFAAMPTLGDIWHNLQYDNFPPLFVFVARFWMALGVSLRLLGLLIGLGTLVVIWFSARSLGVRAPLLVLSLYAVSPLAIRIGDAMRPYGLGIALTLLTMGLMWNFIQNPKRKSLLLAMLTAALSVQCLYQCAFFLIAFSLSAWLVTLGRRQGKVALQTGLIGAVAALSLLPHLGHIRQGNDWLVIAHVPVDFAGLWHTLNESLSASGDGMKFVWLGLTALALVAALPAVWRQKNWALVYCGFVLLTAITAHLAFLRVLSLPLRTWYFLIMLAVTALAIDGVLNNSNSKLKMLAAPLALLVALFSVPKSLTGVQLRHTNLDLVASHLKKTAQPGDMVLVSPWYYGVSFQRYYDTNRFTTIPPMSELRIHRYDLMRDAMDAPDPIGSLKTGIEQTLRGGHTLWVIGNFQFLQPGQAAIPLPEHRPESGGDSLYFSNWMIQLTTLVSAHATTATGITIPVPNDQPVDTVESPPLLMINGWHD